MVFDLITLIEKMIPPAAPLMLGEGTAGQTAEIVAEKCARSRHQPPLEDEQIHITPGLF